MQWPTLKADYDMVHTYMKRQNMRVIIDTMMRYLRNRELSVQTNSIRIIAYLNSQPEFFQQIVVYNDYYQNVEVQDALQDLLDEIPNPPEETCCNSTGTIIFLGIITLSVYFWLWLGGCVKTHAQ